MKQLHIGLIAVQAAFIAPQMVLAHDDAQHCEAVQLSVSEAGFSEAVSVSCDGGNAVISSDSYPDHELMTGIVGTNEQVPVPAKSYDAPIPLLPVLGDTPQTRDAALAVAVNGVPIFDYTGGGEMSQDDLVHYQSQHDTLATQQLDICGGHAGRGDDYHYHVAPTCMIEQMKNAGDDAIIGWAFDGFPIYGDKNPDGTEIAEGDLDLCNGQPDETFGYRYHTSTEAPYIVQCLMGEVASLRDLPRTAPLTLASGGGGIEPGRPPRGGVEDLIFTQLPDGTRSMDYTYEGEAYYMRYSPSETAGCYNFETRTVTNDGALVSEEYCR
ncbi:YHYH protein [Octadecabacter sp. 1_MG-2023]|uniref:YHYH protein n=1 Tax=unclassified Octadecabacter TaxID=196158 RepID=UPI001C0A35E3|nr:MULTISPECIES: YHYH protein [unclassified Octadecabacter]MBU2993234.1 YHYH protein [Octadecabacter sp. B2R22]MDO6733311.1 YHYH protein [Octadecabacter sp. 1_MG-2023]